MKPSTSGLAGEPFYLLCFPTAHLAMRAQVELEDQVRYLVVPTPEKISVSCGISLKIAPDEKDRLYEMIEAGKLPEDSVYLYRACGRGRDAVYEKIAPMSGMLDDPDGQTTQGKETTEKRTDITEDAENQN